MSNPTVEYNNYVRANLPAYITYDSTRNQYVTGNGKRFYTYKEAKWYCDYLIKFGSNLGYSVAGFTPPMVSDFINSKFFVGGVPKSFSETYEHTATTNGTMVDSDGGLKWRPHNLFSYSEDFSNAAWSKLNNTISSDSQAAPDSKYTADTMVASSAGGSGEVLILRTADYGGSPTYRIFIKPAAYSKVFIRSILFDTTSTSTFDLSDGSVISEGAEHTSNIYSVGSGWYLLSVEVDTVDAAGRVDVGPLTDALSQSVPLDGSQCLHVWGGHGFRSDLGGMVNNPDQPAGLETYVPTTTSAVYLPRRGHHIYNGSAWVNEGVLIEPETRTNLVTYSEDFTDASWVPSASSSVTQNTDVSPDGNQNADTYTTPSGTDPRLRLSTSQSVSTSYALSIYAKKGNCNFLRLRNVASSGEVWFNLDTGLVGTETSATGLIEYAENGFYRCTIVSTTGGTISANFVDISCAPTDGSRATAGGETVIIYGAQLEEGSTPSSYIPTSGSQVARAGEQLVLPHENISWPEPKVIGPEKWNTPTISDPAVWSWDGSTLTATGDGTSDTARGDAVSAGGVFLVTYDVTRVSGLCQVRIGNTFVETVGSSGPREKIIVAGDSTGLTFTDSGSFVGSVDNISVKEIEPLALSIHMQGRMTYADEDALRQQRLISWELNANNQIIWFLSTNSTNTGRIEVFQKNEGTTDTVNSGVTAYSPGINVPFNIASRHGSTFVNGAVDGVALTENTTPVAIPDLENTNLQLAYSGGSMVIKQFAMWDVNITDTGTEDATEPSTEPSLSLIFDGSESSFTVLDWSA